MVGMAVFMYYVSTPLLSYIVPDSLQVWALELGRFFVPIDIPNALGINIGNAILIILIGPVIEELLFRGFLLER